MGSAITAQPDTTTSAGNAVSPHARQSASFRLRLGEAISHLKQPLPAQVNNGDNDLYPDKATAFTKCLVHDNFGRVDLVHIEIHFPS